jgi:hypothetical protein
VERKQQVLAVLLGLLYFLPQVFGKTGQIPVYLSSSLRACGRVLDDSSSKPLFANRFQHPLRRDTLRVIGDAELILLQIDFERCDPRKP